MNQIESVQIFFNFLNQRYAELREDLENMLKSMSSNEKKEKVTASKQFLRTASGLALTLAINDRPGWLKKLIENTEWYIANYDKEEANHKHTMRIFSQYEQAMNHEWFLTETQVEIDYSFDKTYQRHGRDSNVIELFDTLVETLNFMIDSCEIDSVSAISSLSQLITLIDQNKSGSYFSIVASQDFITKFMKNGTWMQIRKIPGVKTYKDAFEKIAKEIDAELDRLQRDMVTEIQDRFDGSIKPQAQKNVKKQIMLESVEA